MTLEQLLSRTKSCDFSAASTGRALLRNSSHHCAAIVHKGDQAVYHVIISREKAISLEPLKVVTRQAHDGEENGFQI
jgi:hypothetical protein